MNKLRLILKLTSLLLTPVLFLTACGTWLSNQGTVTLDVQDKTQIYATAQELPSHYKLGNGEQELQKFETFCREEIRTLQLNGREEMIFEDIKQGIHGTVEFKKCSDKVTRIYQY